MTNDSSFDKIYKFVVVGNMNSGKTCIMKRFVEDKFPVCVSQTVGAEFGSKIIKINNESIKIQIWDTAGHERFRSITQSYYRGAVCLFLVYDITVRESFNSLSEWLISIRNFTDKNITIFLVGNKVDLEDPLREITHAEASSFAADNGMILIETSAKLGDNIENLFFEATKRVSARLSNQKFSEDFTAFKLDHNVFNNAGIEKLDSSGRKKNCCH